MPNRIRFARHGAMALGAMAAAALCSGAALAQNHDHHGHHHQHGAAQAAQAEDHSQHMKAAGQPVKAQTVKVDLKDTPLVDQNGRAMRLKSEAIGDRIVVIDFVYTNCTTVCPVNSALFAKVQAELGERVGKEVGLLSITVDPVRDTPARLREYARRYGSEQGWTWLTGAKPQVDEALKVFDAYTANFVEHPAVIMVGDPSTGKWLRFVGFPDPKQITEAVRQLGEERKQHAHHHGSHG